MNVIPQMVRDAFTRVVGPLARTLHRRGVSPSTLTTAVGIVTAGAAVSFAGGNLRLGGSLLLVGGLLDWLEGAVAHLGKRATAFGEFYDATLDRAGEALVFGGIALYFVRFGQPPGRAAFAVGAAIVALAGGLLASYARTRASVMGLNTRVGLVTRAERILVLGGTTVVFGSQGEGWLLASVVAALALAATVTVVQRVRYVATHAAEGGFDPATRKRDTMPGHASALRKGTR